MAFDGYTLNVGVGGGLLALDLFTDADAVQRLMPYGAVAFGSLNGPYTAVDATHGLPVNQQTGATWAVSLASSPLPTGGSTSALQATGNTTLASILTALAAGISVVLTGQTGTLAVGDGGGSLTVDGAFWQAVQPVSGTFWQATQPVSGTFWQATQPVSVAALPLPAGASTEATLAALSAKVTAVNTGAVTISAMPAVSLAAAQTLATLTTLTSLAGSAVAHDGVDAGNPHKIGARGTTSLSSLTLVANADRTDLFAGVDGVQITRPHTNLEDIVDGNASNTTGASTQCIAAAGAGVKQYLTSVVLTNTSAANIYVEILSGTTVKATIPVPANSGAIFNPPVPLKPNAANEAWNFDPSAATTTVYCSMIGFKSKV